MLHQEALMAKAMPNNLLLRLIEAMHFVARLLFAAEVPTEMTTNSMLPMFRVAE
jgi:hypothetical protein